jgi:hypothetical protein
LLPNSTPSRNARYLSNAQLSHSASPKNRPLDSTKTLNLFALAIRLDLPADKLRQLIPAYPSQAANIKYMLD